MAASYEVLGSATALLSHYLNKLAGISK